MFLKASVFLFFSYCYTVLSIEIESTNSLPSHLHENRKKYCTMLSQHYIQSQSQTLQNLLSDFDQITSEIFSSRIENKLKDQCLRLINVEQINQISEILKDSSQSRQKTVKALEYKFQSYFVEGRGEDLLRKLLKQVQFENNEAVQKELKEIQQSKRLAHESTQKLSNSVDSMGKQLKDKTQGLSRSVEQVSKTFHILHEKISSAFIETKSRVEKSPIVGNISNFWQKVSNWTQTFFSDEQVQDEL